MDEDNDELTPEEKLQQENNLLRLKLMAENDAYFPENEKKLDPEQENAWLNYIYNFEKIYKNAPKITVHERLGEPDFPPAHELSNTAIEEALHAVYELMDRHAVALDCICDYPARTIYKFITEELFEYEMDDVDTGIEGMFTHFIYEEFHPNHDYDLRKNTGEFLEALLENKWDDYYGNFLSDEILIPSDECMDRDDFVNKIKAFQAYWEEFVITKKEITKVYFDLEKEEGHVSILLDYEAVQGNERMPASGQAHVGFSYEYDYWVVKKVAIPGFNC